MKGQLKEVRTKEDAQRASSLLISDFLTGQGRAFYTLFDIKPFKKQAFHRGFRQREKAAYDPFRGRRERVQMADLPRRAYRSGGPHNDAVLSHGRSVGQRERKLSEGDRGPFYTGKYSICQMRGR